MWELLKKAQIPLRFGVIIAVVYLGYVYLARHSASQRFQMQQEQKSAPDPKRQAEFDSTYGGSAVKILQFYARDGVVEAGQQTVICYGVVNAKTIKIEPPVRGFSKAISNCVEVQPARTTDYVMTAEGEDGKTVTEKFTLRVK